jgi:hypothetical protein
MDHHVTLDSETTPLLRGKDKFFALQVRQLESKKLGNSSSESSSESSSDSESEEVDKKLDNSSSDSSSESDSEEVDGYWQREKLKGCDHVPLLPLFAIEIDQSVPMFSENMDVQLKVWMAMCSCLEIMLKYMLQWNDKATEAVIFLVINYLHQRSTRSDTIFWSHLNQGWCDTRLHTQVQKPSKNTKQLEWGVRPIFTCSQIIRRNHLSEERITHHKSYIRCQLKLASF